MDEQEHDEAKAGRDYQPGDTVTPGVAAGSPSSDTQTAAAADSEAVSQNAPTSEVNPASGLVQPTEGDQARPGPSGTELQASARVDEANSDVQSVGEITWTASEYVAHEKSAGWYGMLVLAAIALAAIIFLLTKDKISTGVVLVAALALGFYAARKPRELQYTLNAQGLTISDKYFPFDAFRSFAVMDEGHFSSIVFVPLKRFGQLTTIYFDPADEERIVNLLSARLPIEARQHDVVDKFMKRIRF